jgi:diaminobutyrate-2-oxoglutarate transaminase
MDAISRYESEVRSYCRDFPALFETASGARIRDSDGRPYVDFFSGAGALNYGHNNQRMKDAVIAYMQADGIVQALDFATVAKTRFIEEFQKVILKPRQLTYKMQFTGPTGTNAVEAALKLARKVTRRADIIAFTNAFHGMSLGALAASATEFKRNGAGVPLGFVTRFPYDGYLGSGVDTVAYMRAHLDDPGSGVSKPAAIIVETVQAEGGVNVARGKWLRAVAELARSVDALLIVDEIQTGCGRTGPFFSFEDAEIVPDIVCLSKSISGFGLPMTMILMKPELDAWKPGEHNGTFRGNNLAFVAATSALSYWEDPRFEAETRRKGALIASELGAIVASDPSAEVRGRGMLQGIHWKDASKASKVSRLAFQRGLIVETSGARSDVLKLIPPLTIDEGDLELGLEILRESIASQDAPICGRGPLEAALGSQLSPASP